MFSGELTYEKLYLWRPVGSIIWLKYSRYEIKRTYLELMSDAVWTSNPAYNEGKFVQSSKNQSVFIF